jgi:transcriptional regulator with XRE-family HTH domain
VSLADRRSVAIRLGVAIREARRTAKMPIRELAARLRVLPKTVDAWEDGRKRPSLPRLLEIASITGTSASTLIASCEVRSTHRSAERVAATETRTIPDHPHRVTDMEQPLMAE